LEQSAKWEYVSGGVAFLALIPAMIIGVFAGGWATTAAGVTVLLVLTVAFVVAVIAVDVPAAIDRTEGNTFSELLREGGTQTTIFPWAFAVFAGRWFHPVDDFDGLGVAGAVVLMALTFIVVSGGDVLRRRGSAVPSWLVVVAGVLAGALLWPADFSGVNP
jgi:hypothetical protein